MKDIRDVAEFKSGRFLPILPDKCQVNPRTYGAELAFWLAGKLAQQGIVTSYPEPEDWCWMLEFEADERAFFQIICSNVEGSDQHWSISIARCGRGWFNRATPSFEKAQGLVNAIRFVLYAAVPPEDIDWHYADAPPVQA